MIGGNGSRALAAYRKIFDYRREDAALTLLPAKTRTAATSSVICRVQEIRGRKVRFPPIGLDLPNARVRRAKELFGGPDSFELAYPTTHPAMMPLLLLAWCSTRGGQ